MTRRTRRVHGTPIPPPGAWLDHRPAAQLDRQPVERVLEVGEPEPAALARAADAVALAFDQAIAESGLDHGWRVAYSKATLATLSLLSQLPAAWSEALRLTVLGDRLAAQRGTPLDPRPVLDRVAERAIAVSYRSASCGNCPREDRTLAA